MSIHVPAICQKCGTAFCSTNIFGGPRARVVFENCSIGPCPRCGGLGDIPNGAYDLVNKISEVIDNKMISPHQLKSLHSIVNDAAVNKISIKTLEEKVKNQHSEMIPVIAWMNVNGGIASWLQLFLAILITMVKFKKSGIDRIALNNSNNYKNQAMAKKRRKR